MNTGSKRKGLHRFRLFRSIHWRARKLINPDRIEIDGVCLCIDSRARRHMGVVYQEILKGVYEDDERELIQATVRPGDRVLEVGACLGVIGIIAARIVGADNVLCYEANPEIEWLIRRNHELNHLYPTVVMKAVTKNGGRIKFHLHESPFSSSVFSLDHQREVDVDSVPINRAIADFDPSILVIDAEGTELEVLPEADLLNIRAIIVELHSHILGIKGITLIEQALKENGFIPTKRLNTSAICQNVVYERA